MTSPSPTHPAGPKPSWIGGNALAYKDDPIAFIMNNRRDYGDVVYYRLLDFEFYALYHPDDVKEILLTQSKKVIKAPVYKNLLSKYLGNGLLISDGQVWKQQRKLVQPAFHHQRIQNYADMMVRYTHEMVDSWQGQASIDIYNAMTELTLYIVVNTLFNTDIRDTAFEIGELTSTLQEVVNDESSNPIQLPEWIPTPFNRRKKHSIKRLNEITMSVIQDRRASGEDKGDLLSMLLMSTDEDGNSMSDEMVKDEALTIFLAGHDTTANALSWAWYLIGQHPEVEAKLLDEVDHVLGTRPATLSDLKDLTYTEMVFKEAMRLYPPSFQIARQADDDIYLPHSGYTIPKGMGIAISQYALHHDERFFPDPEKFDPERFAPENEGNIHKYAYIPFIYGPRVCVGNAFALMEAQFIMATILQRYQLSLQANQDIGWTALLTLNPDRPIMVDLKSRR